MNQPNKDYLSGSNPGAAQLPNATATLVLGILSIVICFICGIIALVISNRDMEMYRTDPGLYSEASFNSLKAGRICAIVGICLQLVGLLFYILVIVFAVSTATSFN